jgi:hypothetical protein
MVDVEVPVVAIEFRDMPWVAVEVVSLLAAGEQWSFLEMPPVPLPANGKPRAAVEVVVASGEMIRPGEAIPSVMLLLSLNACPALVAAPDASCGEG